MANKIITTKLSFATALIVSTILSAGIYLSTKSHFEQSCEKICAAHEKVCAEVQKAVNIARADTATVFDDKILAATVREGNEEIRAMLQLQHAEIEEDFSNLMLWAAVLMVVFLVFSIYAMYKTDDLIHQGYNSVERIQKLSSKAEDKISEIDKLFLAESENLASQSQSQIKELGDKAKKELDQFANSVGQEIDNAEKRINANIENYNSQVDEKAANVKKQFDDMQGAIINLLKILNAASSPDKK